MAEDYLREAVRRDPRTVPGFARAVELGLTPQIPAEPPTPVTSNSRHLLLAIAGTSFGLLLVVLLLANGTQAPPWLLGVVSAVVFAVVVAMFVRLRRIMWDEIMAGYCRIDYMVALFSRDPEYRFPANRMRGAPWDLRGLWRLADDGSVVVEPDRSVLPPGRYPSPNRPGQLELWTGSAWAYRYEEPRVPFL
ncbi:hypothetical protein [Aeromicrobium duanguangcaii]|uniref:hypothetical protein n=1 Tax=Aeromicrobium duanguangcaii TaxID=2968086 RepID=UPI0020179042|nr:hypothetical protein [Aeromicrobium duanguangcaii]MCL3837995.1 hypothetical protein [Aeromicrobium duanguangcaii]